MKENGAKFVEFEKLSNYSKMNNFYKDWLIFIKEKLDPDKFNPKDLTIIPSMEDYESILKSIFLNLSMKLTALEEDQLKFEEEHKNDKKRQAYDKLKEMYLNPTKAKNYNYLIDELLIDKLQKEIAAEIAYYKDEIGDITTDDYDYYIGELTDRLYSLENDIINCHYTGKNNYEVTIPKIFENIEIYPDAEGVGKDKFYQLRNCLAHHEYSFGIKSLSVWEKEIELGLHNIIINIDNGKIHGKMTLEELLKVLEIYESFSLLFSDKKLSIIYNYGYGDKDKLRKYSYLFKPYDDLTIEEPIDIGCEIYANSEDINDYMGAEDLTSYHSVSKLSESLQQTGYVIVKSRKESLTQEEKEIIKRIDFHMSKMLNSNLENEYSIISEKGEVINKYYESLSKSLCTFNSSEHINFFIKFFGNQIYQITNDGLYNFNPLEYYQSKHFVKYQPCYDENNKNRLIGLTTLSTTPIIYGEFLLEYLFYNFNFVKETNAKESKKGLSLFKYRDINLDDIDVYFYNNSGEILSTSPYEIRNKKKEIREEKIILEKETKKIVEIIIGIIRLNDEDSKNPDRLNKLKKLSSGLSNLINKFNISEVLDIISNNLANSIDCDFTITRKIITKLLKNTYKTTNLTVEEKMIKKQLVKKEYAKYDNSTYDLSKINKKISILNTFLNKPDNETKFLDCSNFLSHFRNSITHGKYTINYLDSFREDGTIDYDNIKFSFIDIDPITKNKVFEIKNITSKRLLEVIESYSKKVEATSNQDFIKEHNREEEIKALLINHGIKDQLYEKIKIRL